MSEAIDILMHEHRFIEQVLGSLATFARDIQQKDAAGTEARETVARYARFFREFADRCHHGKEEARLFTALAEYGFKPDEGPVAVMLHEHELGRELVGRLAQIGDATGPLSADERRVIAAIAGEYGALLSQHIQKEDAILFPMAKHALPADVQTRLYEDFEAFERDEMGEGAHAELHGMAQALIDAHPPRHAAGAQH
jgi:hemerythrin-like domain-containing protein